MAVTINASTTSGLVLGPDNTGAIQLQNNGTTKLTVDSTGTYGQLTLGTALSYTQATNSGTTLDFTGIPSWVKRITVVFNGVSTSGTSDMLLQIGSGSVSTTGYNSASMRISAASTSTIGFVLSGGANLATYAASGSVVLCTAGSNIWVSSGNLGSVAQGTSVSSSGLAPTLTGALDRVRITTVNGTDTFDAGSVNILYEG